jgi:hypothetical protein
MVGQDNQQKADVGVTDAEAAKLLMPAVKVPAIM